MSRIVPAGNAAALVAFADEVSIEVNSQVHALARAIEEARQPGINEVVIAYCTLLVHYDPVILTFQEVRSMVERLLIQGLKPGVSESRLREIPTVYGGKYGPDLPYVAQYHHMAEEEVIRLHSGATYVVYMLGFAPGFPYMGGLPPQLVMPRLESPRQVVPAGTVAIANQATIYALNSPGGWMWLGRTPIRLFDPSADPPTYLMAGDRVRFVPISEEQYLELGGEKAE